MTPAAAIAMLDRQIAAHGQGVELRRVVANGDPVTHPCRGIVRGYRPSEIVGGIMQGDTLVVLSPSGLGGSAFKAAPPREGDRVTIDGRSRYVGIADPVLIGDVLVRLNLTVRGQN